MESSSHKEQPPLTPGVQGLESQHSVRALARYLFTEGTGTRALGVEAPGSDTLRQWQAHIRFAVDPDFHGSAAGHAAFRQHGRPGDQPHGGAGECEFPAIESDLPALVPGKRS